MAAKSQQFKRVLENWRAFRSEQHRWFWIADARTEVSIYALTAAQPTKLQQEDGRRQGLFRGWWWQRARFKRPNRGLESAP